jgi:hypothetical protein
MSLRVVDEKRRRWKIAGAKQGRASIIEGPVPIFFLFFLLRIDDTD